MRHPLGVPSPYTHRIRRTHIVHRVRAAAAPPPHSVRARSLCPAACSLAQVIGTGLATSMGSQQRLLTHGFLLSFVGLVCCALVQLGFLNRTLANSPVSYGVPAYQALLTVLTIVTGGLFFGEFGTMASFDQFVFTVGVAIALLGLLLHSVRWRVLHPIPIGRAAARAKRPWPLPFRHAAGTRSRCGSLSPLDLRICARACAPQNHRSELQTQRIPRRAGTATEGGGVEGGSPVPSTPFGVVDEPNSSSYGAIGLRLPASEQSRLLGSG